MDVAEAIEEDQEMNEFMNDVGGAGGLDMMDMMHRTHQEMSTASVSEAEQMPSLLAQGTTKVTSINNDFTGQPLNLDGTIKEAAPDPPEIKDVASINIGAAMVENEITINIGKQSSIPHSDATEPFMDDDLDDYDAKDDLTKDQQKQDGNVNLARYVAHQMDHLADDVLNVDELEQQHRMRKDPDNLRNIFVLKFGKNEEQHWRLPWNPTTNLLCAMEPNKLLIEQSKYNAMYIKNSLTPGEWKRAMMKRNKSRMQKLKEKNRKYKMKVPSSSGNKNKMNEKKPMKPAMINTLSGASALGVPSGGNNNNNNNLLGVIQGNGGNGGAAPRGTFMQHSMMVHSERTVENAAPTEQEQLMTQQQQQKNNALQKPESSKHEYVMTPITAQIRPELIKMVKPKKYQKRRVSLASVGDDEEDWNDTNSSKSSSDDGDVRMDSEDEEEREVHAKKQSKLDQFHLSVEASGPMEEQTVQRLNSKNEIVNEYSDYSIDPNEIRYNKNNENNANSGGLQAPPQGHAHGGKFGELQATIGDGSLLQWKPPKVSLESWNAVDVWQGILYLGDEWDALNYLQIMDNSIEYFVNCAAGYCAFDYERKLKQFWLENWRTNRQKEREKQKLKNSGEREKRRKIRLKKFQRAHPDWRPRHAQNNHNNHDQNINNGSDPEIEEKQAPNAPDAIVDLDKASIVDFALFVKNQSPVSTSVNASAQELQPYARKQIRFGSAKDEDVRAEWQYFQENRKEYDIIERLHYRVLDLEMDDSDHSSMYDSCISSDEYQYDSDEYDEYLGMSDDEIIDKLCPFKFLNIYAHNWEGYRLLDLHMNDVWNFIEECRCKNMNLKHAQNSSKAQRKVSCLVFCTKNSVPMSRLKMEIAGDPNYTMQQLGRSMCNIIRSYQSRQVDIEDAVWNVQVRLYNDYIDRMNEEHSKSKNTKKGKTTKTATQIKTEIVYRRRKELYQADEAQMLQYKYWKVDDTEFWEDFEMLKTREDPLNRLFASSYDRSASLVLGFMIHSGIRLKQALKALQRNKPNTLRNQSFLRQLIQLDWMKHMFAKPGMRQQVPFRDEYDCYQLDHYLRLQKHYKLK